MSVQTQVLFGNRLYDVITYSTNNDPETFSASLSDSMTLTDPTVADTIITVLSDLLTLSDSRIIATEIKVLSDSVSFSDSLANQIAHSFSDSLSVSDVKTILATKALSDFLILNEWISIQLTKPDIWTIQDLTESELPLYSQHLYSQTLYGGVPASTWITTADPAENFTNIDGEGNVP